MQVRDVTIYAQTFSDDVKDDDSCIQRLSTCGIKYLNTSPAYECFRPAKEARQE